MSELNLQIIRNQNQPSRVGEACTVASGQRDQRAVSTVCAISAMPFLQERVFCRTDSDPSADYGVALVRGEETTSLPAVGGLVMKLSQAGEVFAKVPVAWHCWTEEQILSVLMNLYGRWFLISNVVFSINFSVHSPLAIYSIVPSDTL